MTEICVALGYCESGCVHVRCIDSALLLVPLALEWQAVIGCWLFSVFSFADKIKLAVT